MKVPKINLDPSKRPKEVLTVFQGPVADRDPRKTVQQNGHSTTNTNIAQNGGQNGTVSVLRISIRILSRKLYVLCM